MRSPVLRALFLTLGLLVLAAAPACLLLPQNKHAAHTAGPTLLAAY